MSQRVDQFMKGMGKEIRIRAETDKMPFYYYGNDGLLSGNSGIPPDMEKAEIDKHREITAQENVTKNIKVDNNHVDVSQQSKGNKSEGNDVNLVHIYSKLNITDETYQYRLERYSNNAMRPQKEGIGERGEPVKFSAEKQKIADEKMKEASINIVASDLMAMDRSLPDTRHPECKHVKYPEDLPTASVITIFCDEVLSAVLRTIHSIVNRSPPRYLKEVIVVDDASTHADLGQNLDDIIASTWPDGIVKLLRLKERSGLIRARTHGMQAATGDVLVVMDGHCEVNVQWLEPILFRIKQDRKVLVTPVVDDIYYNTLQYKSNGGEEGVGLGGFSWDLEHSWILPHPSFVKDMRHSAIDPYPTPVIIGCAFAIEKDYFFEIGAFDDGMDVWGGENIELPIRIWMCGGRVEELPCSRVGHIYRKRRPYDNPGGKDTMGINSKRAVEVWFDEYKKYFYQARPEMLEADPGDLSSRIALREKLQCHDFKWYMQNVYPYKFVPEDGLLLSKGYVKNNASMFCLDTLGGIEKRTDVQMKLYFCDPKGSSHNQEFYLTKHGELRKDFRCMTSNGGEGDPVWLRYCHEVRISDNQEWKYDEVSHAIIHVKSNLCVDVSGQANEGNMVIRTCNGATSQQWTLQNYDNL